MKYLFIGTIAMAMVLLPAFRKPDLVVTSAAFVNNSIIPVKYSCEGVSASPPLHVTGIPAATRSLALIVHDPDAPKPGGVTHWVMWNINISGEIPEDYREAMQGTNSEQGTGYLAICPADGTHHYHFRVYALDKMLSLDKTTGKAELEQAMQGHILAQTDIVGLYRKTK